MRASTITTACSIFTAFRAVSAVNPIVTKGQDFVDSVTNNRFVIVGVDYQPGGDASYYAVNTQDVLSNATACLRDAAIMQELGINTIRSYNVDPTLNHDECASIFNDVGIYMILDVNSPLSGQSIDRTDPSSSYTLSYLEHIFGVVENFKNYPNTLGFFAGNEVINDDATAAANPPYIRAVQRDLKQYIAKQASRTIPVGYSAADVADILVDTWEYMQCEISGATSSSSSDFFGLNDYEWCGNATYTSSGYDVLLEMFGNTTIPIFFSEYGCNAVEPRIFTEVAALYGEEMTAFSGGLVYEFSQETDNYGLVQIYSNASAQLLVDYDNLQAQYNKLNVTLLESSNSTATALSAPVCAASLITNSAFSNSFDLPAQPAGAAALISSGVTGVVTGSLVSVTQTSVSVPVYAANGARITGLAIKASNGSNTPSGEDSGSSSVSGSSTRSSSKTSSSTSTKETGSATSSSATTATSKASSADRLNGAGAGGVMALLLGAGILAL